MAPTKDLEDIELIIEDIGRGGGSPPPPSRDGGGGGGDANPNRRRRPAPSTSRPYQTAIILGMLSIVMFFMALAATFLVRKTATDWVPVRLPFMVWINTVILLASSGTVEFARRKLAAGDLDRFHKSWRITTVLGLLFLVGQVVAWHELVAQGFSVDTNPASSFFYIFTAAHGAHLLGGVCALFYVLFRNFDKTRVSRATAAEVTSYYWHFMDALWLFLLALLYLGR
jgi:cytochrome c oxidase subunit III